MAGTMRRMAEYLGLVEESYEVDGYEEERPAERASDRPGGYRSTERAAERVSPVAETRAMRPVPEVSQSARNAPISVAERPVAAARATQSFTGESHRITTLHTSSFSDARRIGEEFREGVPVIVNLTAMEHADAKRILDFAAGLIFGLRGTIERLTNKVFLLSPANVDVGAAARAQIAQDGFFNQS